MAVLLKRLEVEGFRYFSWRVSLDFDQGLTVIAGPVGTGKSSLLAAISYALYGLEPGLRRRLYQKSELINAKRSSARVTLELASENGLYRFSRELSREKGEVSVATLPDGRVIRGSRAVQQLAEGLLGLDFEEFSRSVSLSFASLLLLAYGTHEMRSRVLDRLLGLDSITALARSISLRPIKQEIEGLQQRIRQLEERKSSLERRVKEEEERFKELKEKQNELIKVLENIRSEISKLENAKNEFERTQAYVNELSNVIKKLKQRLSGQGMRDEYSLLSIADEARHHMLRIAELLPVPSSLRERLERLQMVPGEIRPIYDVLKETYDELSREYQSDLRSLETDKAAKVTECEMRLRSIDEQLMKLEVQVRDYEDLEKELASLQRRFGSESQLRSEISRLEREYNALRESVLEARAAGLLLRRVIEELRTRGEARCPVCGASLSKDFLESLEPRGPKGLPEQEAELKRKEEELQKLRQVLSEYQEIKARLIELEGFVAEYEELESLRERYSRECEEAKEELERARQEYRAIEVQLDKVGGLLLELKEGIDGLEIAKEVQRLEQEIERKRLLLEQLAPLKSRYDELERQRSALSEQLRSVEVEMRRLESSPYRKELEEVEWELSELSERLQRLERVYRNLSRVREALFRALTTLREERVKRVNEVMNSLLREIYPYTDIEEVRLSVEQPPGRRSIFRIDVKIGGEWMPFTARLSDGQKTVVVLALLASIFKLIPHNCGFMLLDEPLPNVDDRVKMTFMRNIFGAAGVKQVIITTQAEGLATSLREARVLLTEKLRAESPGTKAL